MPRAKILVVEDERPLNLLIKTKLEAHGYDVVQAYDGEAALKLIMAEPPDLVVLDIMLPLLDGWEVLERMRGQAQTANLPVICLTALSEQKDIARGWNAGTDCYLTKPVDLEALLKMVERFMDVS